ncbi:MAG: hypothetical protein U9R74_12675 [Pseudomonadota bacterium]|nr:hypothetical protein [Pseudomonadota bacterium]
MEGITAAGIRLNSGVILFVVGLVLMVAALLLGSFVSPELSSTGFSELMAASSNMEKVAFFFFAFGFPAGLVIVALGARLIGNGRVTLVSAALGSLVALSALLTPLLFGRETGGYYFGIGGVTIMISAVTALWFWGQIRTRIPSAATSAWDLVAAGGVCLAVAAWNLCGAAAMPSFLLFPEQSIALRTRPFAVGQLKSVMAMLVLGWICLALAAYQGARFLKARDS